MNEVKEVLWPVVILMAFLGVITLWLKQLMMSRSNAVPGMSPIGLREYWLVHWPATIFALTSTIGGLVYLDYLGFLYGKAGPALAFGVGFIGNNIADLIGGRVQAMINAAPPPAPGHVSRQTTEEIKDAVGDAVDASNKRGE